MVAATQPQRLARVRAAILCTLLCVLSQTLAIQDDAPILLEFAAGLQQNLNGWRLDNVANMCVDWEGVICNSDGRVRVLDLGQISSGVPRLSGTISSSLANLTSLEYLDLYRNPIRGLFPMDLFNLPNISHVDLTGAGLDVPLPATLSPTLSVLRLGDAFVNSTLPNMNWSQLNILEMMYCHLRCPLPQSFVEFVLSGGKIPNCVLRGNFFTVDSNNMLCGQIPLNLLSCSLTPVAFNDKYFDSDVAPTDVQFRAEYGNQTLEFVDSEVRIFATYMRNGRRTEYRKEYVSFKMLALTEAYAVATDSYFKTFNLSSWQTFLWETPNRLRANMTRMENLTEEVIFDFGGQDADGNPKIKFSIVVYNSGYVFRDHPEPDSVGVPFVINYKMAHSLADGPPPRCSPLNIVSASCIGTLANFSSQANTLTAEVTQTLQSKTILMRFSYGYNGFADTQPLSSYTSGTKIGVLPYPLPSVNWLVVQSKLGFAPSFAYKPQDEQSYIVSVQFTVARFQNRILYDPDITISLLFNPGDESDPAQTAGMTGGVIAAIVIAVIVGIAGVTVGAKFLFPYLARSSGEEALQPIELDSTEGSSPNAKSSWAPARPRETD